MTPSKSFWSTGLSFQHFREKKLIACSCFHLRYVIHEQFWTSIINIRKGNNIFLEFLPPTPYHITFPQNRALQKSLSIFALCICRKLSPTPPFQTKSQNKGILSLNFFGQPWRVGRGWVEPKKSSLSSLSPLSFILSSSSWEPNPSLGGTVDQGGRRESALFLFLSFLPLPPPPPPPPPQLAREKKFIFFPAASAAVFPPPPPPPKKKKKKWRYLKSVSNSEIVHRCEDFLSIRWVACTVFKQKKTI